MANFSENNARQLYVVTSKETDFKDSTAVGAFAIKGDKAKSQVFFNYQTPNGDFGGATTIRTDIIPVKNITNAVASKGVENKLKKFEIKTNPAVMIAPGMELTIYFTFYGLGIGGVENKYVKMGGSIKVNTTNSATIMQDLAKRIEINFSREPVKLINVSETGGTITIEAAPQPWVLGKRQGDQLDFQIHSNLIDDGSGSEISWMEIEDVTAKSGTAIKNGRKVADMEWFYYGGRGDSLRGVGYPNNFDSKYVADPSKEYDFVDIEYFYAGDHTDVQHSKKMISLAVAKDSTYAITDVIADLTAAGVTVTDLTV